MPSTKQIIIKDIKTSKTFPHIVEESGSVYFPDVKSPDIVNKLRFPKVESSIDVPGNLPATTEKLYKPDCITE